MTAVLLWKEYRQQRAVWLAMAFSAILLVLSLAKSLGQGSLWQVLHEESMAWILSFVVAGFSIFYGVMSGALLLAGESDGGTWVFLDNLTGRRGPLFVRKVLAGVILTLSLTVFLAALSLALGFGSWESALFLVLFGLDALVWGLLAGALCRKVLVAGLIGSAFLAAGWFLTLVLMVSIGAFLHYCGAKSFDGHLEFVLLLLLSKPLVDGVGGYLSWRIYCRDDLARRRTAPFTGRILFWLALRQGRWILGAGLVGALLLGILVNWQPFIAWPLGSLLLGLVFGLAVFILDQQEANRFLGAQRFPLGQIWTVKILFWGMALLLLTILAWFGSALVHGHYLFSTYFITQDTDMEQFHRWAFLDTLAGGVSPFLLVGLWPLYGFCFGQFFGQLVPRPVLAVILALFLTPLVVATWVPAMVFGGLPVWQVLIIPGLLLLTTRLALWPWISGRLLSAKPLLGIAVAIALMVLSLIGCRWYRAIEVPDVGEPFDVQAFLASRPSQERSEAGRLIRIASATLREQREQIEFFQGGKVEERTTVLLQEIMEKGWPQQDKELGRWLDQLFAGAWVQQAEKAAALPPSTVEDFRFDNADIAQDCRVMATLFILRGLQRQTHKDQRGALHDLDTALALSRLMRNNGLSILLNDGGFHLEADALKVFRLWLHDSGPDKDQLRAALTMLQKHEAALPDPAALIKELYLLYRRGDPPFQQESPFVNELLRIAYQAPGEKERHLRILDALVSGQLRTVQEPYWKTLAQDHARNPYDFRAAEYDHLAVLSGLPLEDGPGSHLSARQWGELVYQFTMTSPWKPDLMPFTARSQQSLRAAELAVAATLYQADHGKPPDQLDDLVPTYLAALPDDPYTGQPFLYRIFTFPGRSTKQLGGLRWPLSPGQSFVESEDHAVFYPLPVWPRKEKQP